ncbi:hypothetical protein OQA88_8129 [Cercophora sp. LCS_1]
MGRWGHRLFQNDEDAGFIVEMAKDLSDGEYGPEFALLMHHALVEAPPPLQALYEQEFAVAETMNGTTLQNVRAKFDAGLRDTLFAKYRGLEADTPESTYIGEGKYRVIILSALMMMTSAAIVEDNIQHLKKLLSEVPCREYLRRIGHDTAFRGSGKRQFLTALDNYKDGRVGIERIDGGSQV